MQNQAKTPLFTRAVESCSDFVCSIGCNIPTGKDSLSMTQKYPDGTKVTAPGTVIISASAERRACTLKPTPVLNPTLNSTIYYIDFSSCKLALGGSALFQTLGKAGGVTPDVTDPAYFAKAFNTVNAMVNADVVEAIHDVSAGGLVTALLEMCFANTKGGLNMYTDGFSIYGETTL